MADQGNVGGARDGEERFLRYSVPQAARSLGISEDTVRRRCANGLLKGERVGSRWFVYVPYQPVVSSQRQVTADEDAQVGQEEPLLGLPEHDFSQIMAELDAQMERDRPELERIMRESQADLAAQMEEMKVNYSLLSDDVLGYDLENRLQRVPEPELPPIDQNVEVTAEVSDEMPMQHSVVTVIGHIHDKGQGVAGVAMTTAWHHASTTGNCVSTTDNMGTARCERHIGSATPGYLIHVDVAFAYKGRPYGTSVTFTPQADPAR
jgi:hypothetical protein